MRMALGFVKKAPTEDFFGVNLTRDMSLHCMTLTQAGLTELSSKPSISAINPPLLFASLLNMLLFLWIQLETLHLVTLNIQQL